MSDEKKLDAQLDGKEGASASFLDQAIQATQQTAPDKTQDLLKNLVEAALKGTVTWDKNLNLTVNNSIKAIDELISKQLAAVMHHKDLQTLEGSWRGLQYLTMNSETGSSLKIKVMNLTKDELGKDLSKATDFDQSQIFKKLYESEFGTPGGEPYGVLIGNYQFGVQAEELNLLNSMAGVAAAAFCPFITAASPQLFGFNEWSELSKPRDLEKNFDTADYIQWRSFRENEDSRFVTLTLPRVLARLPYGQKGKNIEEFNYEELPLAGTQDGKTKAASTDNFTWMNAAFVYGTRLADAFAKYGWCTAIRGAEGGGKVENLPTHIFISDDGDPAQQCPTEIGITDRREAELSKLGFLPLCHYKNTDYAVIFGAQTAQKPQKYDRPDATANAAISARLPYLMATSRFAHYLKIMARDKIGSFMEAKDVESWLNRWILNYVNTNSDSGSELKAKYPLAEARIEVKEIPGKPGSYNAIAWLRPWLQLEELTTSLRLVANIPKLS
jgi:type VI secretion system protein ImpC